MNFLLEIGTEEIPAGFLEDGRNALRSALAARLEEAGVPAPIRVLGTPRRLAALVEGLPERTPDREETHKGPPARVAFGADGSPTKAAEGFARKLGLALGDLQRDGEYVVATVRTAGRPIEEALGEMVPAVLDAMPWPKSMKWNATQKRFVRAVRWIAAFLGDRPVPFSWAGVTAGRVTRVRRYTRGAASAGAPETVSAEIAIPSADGYIEALSGTGVLVDQAARRRAIEEQVAAAAAAEQATPVLVDGDRSIPFLADHVEDPEVVLGEFDASFTDVPREVLELTMWRHQKYIPLERDGRLIARFLIVANRTFGAPSGEAREEYLANVRAGNRRVLSARLSDARYFWMTDRERPLADRVKDLDRVTFQRDAGSLGARVARIVERAVRFAPILGVTDVEAVRRAATLAKADLTTKMVFEFPELQGVVGRRIAEAEGADAAVAEAIETHYWPLGADPRLPSGIGAVVALAEKADTLESIFGVGLEPTGSADPYGLRRAAIGIIRILLDADRPIRVSSIVGDPKVLSFVRDRLLNFAGARIGAPANVLEAVAASGWDDLRDFQRRAEAASRLAKRADYADLATSFKRVMNILDPSAPAVDVRADFFREEAERSLHASIQAFSATLDACIAGGRIEEAFDAMASVKPAVDRFFDDVLVNAPEEELARNRKALLASLGRQFLRLLDFSRL